MFSERGIGEFKGLFSSDHLIFSLVGVLLIILLLYITRKFDSKKINKVIIFSFFFLFILEVLKIIWNIKTRTNLKLHHYVPLYFCSLYIYASLFYTIGYFIKNNVLMKLGLSWIVYGQIFAGLCFLLYPSSSIGLNPILHVMSFHSLIYHVVSCFTGLLIITKGFYKVNIKDILIYGVTTFIMLLFIFIFNVTNKTNLAFINEPFLIPILEKIASISPVLYIIFAFFGHIFILFFLSFGLYKIAFKYILKEVDEKEGYLCLF